MAREKSTRQQIIALLEAAAAAEDKNAEAVIHGTTVRVNAGRRGRRYGRETYKYSATGTKEKQFWPSDKNRTVEWLMTQLDPATIAKGIENERKWKEYQVQREKQDREEAAARVKREQETEPLRVAIRSIVRSHLRTSLPNVIFDTYNAAEIREQLQRVMKEGEFSK